MGISIILALVLFVATVPILGRYMAKIFSDQKPLNFLEKRIYQWCSIDPSREMTWTNYLQTLLIFNFIGFLFLFVLLIFQRWLPLNPQNFPDLDPYLAFNTTASFVTNTDWQAYDGETTMSSLSQMMGLTVQNFLSAATGNAVLLALIRGITRTSMSTIGNFWVDVTRTVLYLLLPLSILLAIVLVSQGVIQNFKPYLTVQTLEDETQTIPMGPVASQIAIKQLGTNGGGFFNANSAHPFENPNWLTNLLQTLAILVIPGSTICMYSHLIGSKRQCVVIFAVMLLLLCTGLGVALFFEVAHNPLLSTTPLLEGKEIRFGLENSILWAISTTATSNGSVNSMLSSLSPLAGGMAMFNIMIGEVIFGGVGVGLCSMLVYILLTVFLAGLMVGRSPEYLGKKIEKRDIQWVMLAILVPYVLILLSASLSLLFTSPTLSRGPHGMTEFLYAFTSTGGNNGSAFAGFDTNSPYYNILLGIIMILGRLSIVVPSLAIAGNLVKKQKLAPSPGTFATDTFQFGLLLSCVIIIEGALTFFPALSLGPILEQFLLSQGRSL